MSDAVRFEAEVLSQQCDEFTGLAYVYGMSGCEELEKDGITLFTCYFNTQEELDTAIVALKPFTMSIKASEVIKDRDWNAKWRETIEPVLVTDNIWVSPEWLEPPLKSEDNWIKIEPRMAFGTGHHETTRVSSQAIFANPAKSMLDIGTGSGILAFVAELVGYEKIVGIEIDPDCKINLQENLEANRKSADITFDIGSVDIVEDGAMFDTVVMNIIRTHSEPLLLDAKKHLNRDGKLIWSGILIEEKQIVLDSAKEAGFKVKSETNEGEWWCGVFSLE